MRGHTCWMVALTLLGGAGVSGVWGQEPIDPRGPYPDLGKGNVSAARVGTLEIHSEVGDLRGGSRQVQDERRPRYRIYDDQGQLQREVVDVTGTGNSGPIDLPPGKYLVRIVGHGLKTTTVRVTVVEGRSTVVDAARAGEGEEHDVPAPGSP